MQGWQPGKTGILLAIRGDMEILTFRRKLWLGVHRFRVNGQQVKIRSGETISCTVEEIGLGFLNQYDCLSGNLPADNKNSTVRTLEIIPNERLYFYDIVNPDFPDRPLNDAPVRKVVAKKLLEELIGTDDER